VENAAKQTPSHRVTLGGHQQPLTCSRPTAQARESNVILIATLLLFSSRCGQGDRQDLRMSCQPQCERRQVLFQHKPLRGSANRFCARFYPPSREISLDMFISFEGRFSPARSSHGPFSDPTQRRGDVDDSPRTRLFRGERISPVGSETTQTSSARAETVAGVSVAVVHSDGIITLVALPITLP
jgi:hypothetical protein